MNIMTGWSALVIGWLLVAFATLGASQAHADAKNYPGSMCVRVNGGIPRYDSSSIGNAAVATATNPNFMHVDCPAVKDGAKIISGWVRVTDHNVYPIKCTLVMVYRQDTGSVPRTYYPDPPETQYSPSVDPSPDVRQLNFGAASSGSDALNNLSHYYYSCDIPGATADGISPGISYIHTYQVRE